MASYELPSGPLWQTEQQPSREVHILFFRTCEYVTLAKGTFATVIKVKDLDVGRLSWILQVGSILHEPFKMENVSGLQTERCEDG